MLSLPPGIRHIPFYLDAAAQDALLADIRAVVAAAPLYTPAMPRTGKEMSVRMTNCGPLGWVTDKERGYRYQATHPLTGKPWPEMPESFRRLAADAAAAAGFPGFAPEACLINCYVPGTRLTLHQDRDERNYDHPIVSVSLGLPATFQFGGPRRGDPARRVALYHGDVVVWGGPSRLYHHGVLPVGEGMHPATGGRRINLTFRRAA